VKPVLVDLRRQFSMPSIWIVLVLVVCASGGPLFLRPAGAGVAGQFIAVTVSYSSHYEFDILVFDGSGGLIGDAQVNVTLRLPNDTGPPVGSANGSTSSEGTVAVFLTAMPSRYAVTYHVVSSHGTAELDGYPLAVPSSKPMGPSLGGVSLVESGDFSLTPYIAIAVPGPGDKPVPGLSIAYYINETGTGAPGTGRNFTGTLGPVTAVLGTVHFDLPAGASTGFPVVVSLVNSTGGVVTSRTFELSDVVGQPGAPGKAGVALESWLQTTGFLVLLAAVYVGYVSYGRDRASGALEPVLALPVSRVRILAIRFISSTVALALGVSAAVGVLVAGIGWGEKVATPGVLIAAVWAGTLCEGLSLLAITFLVSHLSRSHGALLAGGLALSAVFSILWGLVTLLVGAALGVLPPTQATLGWQGSVGVLSPTGAAVNPVGLTIRALAPNGSQILATAPNPTLGILALILWVILPLLALAWLARYRD
jgi:ABC-type transport system involved in multi-copper enzyme maturation permease subunit